ncbi:MAG: IS5 family transposase [Anaerolineae bacterium]|nr:IS5 family transposase [Anaerolineae bacterium]
MAKQQKNQSKAKKKASYRVSNWSAYNKSLMQRGSLTIWIDEEVVANWHPPVEGKRKRGGQVQYSDQAIECLLMLKAVYGLPYRQTIGFAQSILNRLEADVRVPDYSLLCKRSKSIIIDLPVTSSTEAKHVVLDSTGLKVYGEGEWKVRQHGYSKRRTWRKLHLSVDENTQELQAVVLTEAGVDDAEAGKQLLDETPGEIGRVGGDGAYDKRKFYDASTARGIDVILVPPRRDAKIWQHGNCKKAPLPRDENLRRIRQVGRQTWKDETGYHQRSLAETAVFRFKVIFGNSLTTRTIEHQVTEVRIKAAALNRMTQLGMPDSYRIA